MTRRTSPPSAAEAELAALSARGRRTALALGVASRAGRILAALGLAGLAGGLVIDERLAAGPLALLATGLLLAALCGAAAEHVAARTERMAADRAVSWFSRLAGRAPVSEAADFDPGDLCGRLARQPRAAAELMVSVANAKALSGAGLLMALGAMTVFSWQAALMLLLCLPVMVMFFIMVGGLTKRRAERQEAAMQAVSGAFAERVRCLPTLLASHAEHREEARLAVSLRAHEARSQDVLRVAFLNAGVLDFFTSLSIAMLAVFMGLGHLGLAQVPGFSGLSLTESLSVLVLAPEAFSPLRRFAERYHAAAEGRAALDALGEVEAAREVPDPRLSSMRFHTRGLVPVHGRAAADLDLPQTGLVAITGPSGSGKTRLLRALAGVDAPALGRVTAPQGGQGWAACDAWLPGGPLSEVLGEGLHVAEALGLLDEPRFAGGAASRTGAGSGDLSGGQRLRLSLARAAGRAEGTLFADEPTAKLDAANAERMRSVLQTLAQSRLVIVATHDPILAGLAGHRVSLAPRAEECAA